MADILIQIFNSILLFFTDIGQFFERIWDFFQQGIYDLITEWFAAFVIWSTVQMIQFKILMVGFAWDVAQQVLTELNISSFLSSAWGQLNGSVLSAMTFFNIPDAINILISAKTTRFVLNFIGM